MFTTVTLMFSSGLESGSYSESHVYCPPIHRLLLSSRSPNCIKIEVGFRFANRQKWLSMSLSIQRETGVVAQMRWIKKLKRVLNNEKSKPSIINWESSTQIYKPYMKRKREARTTAVAAGSNADQNKSGGWVVLCW